MHADCCVLADCLQLPLASTKTLDSVVNVTPGGVGTQGTRWFWARGRFVRWLPGTKASPCCVSASCVRGCEHEVAVWEAAGQRTSLVGGDAAAMAEDGMEEDMMEIDLDSHSPDVAPSNGFYYPPSTMYMRGTDMILQEGLPRFAEGQNPPLQAARAVHARLHAWPHGLHWLASTAPGQQQPGEQSGLPGLSASSASSPAATPPPAPPEPEAMPQLVLLAPRIEAGSPCPCGSTWKHPQLAEAGCTVFLPAPRWVQVDVCIGDVRCEKGECHQLYNAAADGLFRYNAAGKIILHAQ